MCILYVLVGMYVMYVMYAGLLNVVRMCLYVHVFMYHVHVCMYVCMKVLL